MSTSSTIPPEEARDRAVDDADGQDRDRPGEADPDRDPPADGDPREEVAAELVGSERVLEARRAGRRR